MTEIIVKLLFFLKLLIQRPKLIKELPKSYSGSYMALLSYRTTPLPWCNLSPSELLIGNKTRTDVPQTTSQLTPQWSCLNEFRTMDKEFKEKQ